MTNTKTTYGISPTSSAREYIDACEARDFTRTPHRRLLNFTLISRLGDLSRERKQSRDLMFINRVFKLSYSLFAEGRESLVYFLHAYFEKYNPSRIARRAAYLSLLNEIWRLEEEINRLKEFCKELDLTDANTRLKPEPSYITVWHESRRREDERQRLFAKHEQVARRRIRRRAVKSGSVPPGHGTAQLSVRSDA